MATPTAKLTPANLAWLSGLIAVGILLRLAGMSRSYWSDELFTMVLVSQPTVDAMLKGLATDVHPPLYEFLGFGWIRLFGYGEVAMRSLSLLLGLAALVTPWLARTALTQREKWLCCVIVGALCLPIRFSQELRSYSLMLLLSSICLFSYLELVTVRNRWLTIGFYASLALLAFTHLFGLLLAVSYIGTNFLVERRIGPRLLGLLFGVFLTATVMLPLIEGGLFAHTNGNFWIKFTPYNMFIAVFFVFTPVGAAILGYGALLRWRAQKPIWPESNVMWATLPSALLFVGAIVISFRTPIITDRNFIGLTPAFALITAKLLADALSLRPVITLGLLTLLPLQSAALMFSGKLFARENFRSIAEQSVATNSRVCYLVRYPVPPNTPAADMFSFYTGKILRRPDLPPTVLMRSQVSAVDSNAGCALWADAHRATSEPTLVDETPLFSRCTAVPLSDPFGQSASRLIRCPTSVGNVASGKATSAR